VCAEHVEKQGFRRKRHELFIAHGGAPCQSGGDVKIQNREQRWDVVKEQPA